MSASLPASSTHLVLIPSYNTGALLVDTVRAARAQWAPVWIVIDGSSDDSAAAVHQLAAEDQQLRVIELSVNSGKGAAVLVGLELAADRGFSHVLTMDADGQHPAALIPAFMAASQAEPGAMILGRPIFGPEAPAVRVNGRKVSNLWANIETLWAGIGDSLYGFRIYPVKPLRDIMRRQRWMRRFDFDPEAAIRLCWAGITPRNIDAPVRYLAADEGGVSHFRYLRDNILLISMHIRLVFGAVARLPWLVFRRWRKPL